MEFDCIVFAAFDWSPLVTARIKIQCLNLFTMFHRHINIVLTAKNYRIWCENIHNVEINSIWFSSVKHDWMFWILAWFFWEKGKKVKKPFWSPRELWRGLQYWILQNFSYISRRYLESMWLYNAPICTALFIGKWKEKSKSTRFMTSIQNSVLDQNRQIIVYSTPFFRSFFFLHFCIWNSLHSVFR